MKIEASGPAFSARVEKLREDRLRSLGYEVVGLHGRYACGPKAMVSCGRGNNEARGPAYRRTLAS